MNTFFDGQDFSLYRSDHTHRGEVHHEPVYYGVQFNYSGGLFLQINHGELFRVDGPHAFITHPGSFFEYGNWKTPSRSHNFLCCFGPRIQTYLETGLLPIDDRKPLIPILKPEKMLEIMLEIMALLHSSGDGTPPRAILLFEELLLMLHEEISITDPVPAHRRDALIALIEQIRKHPEKDYPFERLAALQSMGGEYFRRLFKTMCGLPPVQFHIRCRMRMASELLINTKFSVKEICRACGMDNEYYFSRLFRKHFRVAPGEYRREFRQTVCSPEFRKNSTMERSL